MPSNFTSSRFGSRNLRKDVNDPILGVKTLVAPAVVHGLAKNAKRVETRRSDHGAKQALQLIAELFKYTARDCKIATCCGATPDYYCFIDLFRLLVFHFVATTCIA